MQVYVLYYLPFVDCLPFKKGNLIAEQMKAPAGSKVPNAMPAIANDHPAENMSTNALIVPPTLSSDTCQAAPSSAA